MLQFKFFRGNPYEDRTINRNYYRRVNPIRDAVGQQPIKMAVINAVNICNRTDTRYDSYEHYFTIEGTQMVLKIMEVRSYRNPVHSFFKIRYKMCLSTMNLDDNPVFTELRLNEEEYNRLIIQRPDRENI
jgi:hypothetical protein